uniref:Uncharacterized protein n=1 Tax=Arundo donax TaxID=35708 RepID=A0A0A8XVM8_ARUDO
MLNCTCTVLRARELLGELYVKKSVLKRHQMVMRNFPRSQPPFELESWI